MAQEPNTIAQKHIKLKVKKSQDRSVLDIQVIVDNALIYDGPLQLMSFDEWSEIVLPIEGEF
jgi:hypothetical protein